MPWKDSSTWSAIVGSTASWWRDSVVVIGSSFAVLMGMLAKIASDIQNGQRRRFLSRRLWMDVPAIIAMVAIAAGITIHYGLEGWPASAVGVVCGWLGPRSIDVILMALADRVRGGPSS